MNPFNLPPNPAYREELGWPASESAALVFGLAPSQSLGGADSGEKAVHLPSLKAHAAKGFKYDLAGANCVFRWANVPRGYSGPVDVVIHFHGFKEHDRMSLAQKASISGLDLGGVQRPTLGLIPHGQAYHPCKETDPATGACLKRDPLTDGFQFPAIADRAGLARFIDESLTEFGKLIGARPPSLGRTLLTAHSGGGKAVTTLLKSLVATPEAVQAAHYFDATYGGAGLLTATGGWLDQALARDAKALAGMTSAAQRASYLQAQGASLRIQFIEGTGTAKVAHGVDDFIRRRLASLVSDPAVRAELRCYYRAQKVAGAGKVGHNDVPKTYGGRLLADPADDLAPDSAELGSPQARAHGFEAPVRMGTTKFLGPRIAGLSPDRMTGNRFIESILGLSGKDREKRIYAELAAGNMPHWMGKPCRVDGVVNGKKVTFYTTPDVLCIGMDGSAKGSFVRIPMTPVTAQRLADAFGMYLPTAKMVDMIYRQATQKAVAQPRDYASGNPEHLLPETRKHYAEYPPDLKKGLAYPPPNLTPAEKTGPEKDWPKRPAIASLQLCSEAFREHSFACDREFAAHTDWKKGELTAGHKKELVITDHYPRKEEGITLAFYGFFRKNQKPIQGIDGGYPGLQHNRDFVDYSHGARLIWPNVSIDGVDYDMAQVLADEQLYKCIATESHPLKVPRFDPEAANALFNQLGARANSAAYPYGLDAPDFREYGAEARPFEATDVIPVGPVRWIRQFDRPASAPGGTEFIRKLYNIGGLERERRIRDELFKGNLPEFLTAFAAVSVGGVQDDLGNTYDIEFYVTSDYLSIGSDEDYTTQSSNGKDFIRIPMTPVTAQEVADHYGCLLPTAKMVDHIYRKAKHLPYLSRDYSAGTGSRDAKKLPNLKGKSQESSQAYEEHSKALDARLTGSPGQLVEGHKKCLVITHQYGKAQTGGGKLAFYGWFQADGKPIEPFAEPDPQPGIKSPRKKFGFPVQAHDAAYADYSHGVRLVWPYMKLRLQGSGGWEIHRVAKILKDPVRFKLIEAEQPILNPRYTGAYPPGFAASAKIPSKANALALGADAHLDAAALGYGGKWDFDLYVSCSHAYGDFATMPVEVDGQRIMVHVPYFMNAQSIKTVKDCPAPGASASPTAARYCEALRNRAAASKEINQLLNQLSKASKGAALVGKGQAGQIRDFLQAALDAGQVANSLKISRAPNRQDCRDFLVKYGIGIDCSGFAAQILNELAVSVGKTPGFTNLVNTGTGSLRAPAGNFVQVKRPDDLRPGDTMNRPSSEQQKVGHVRVIAAAEKRGDRYYFETVESKSGTGPALAYWRLVPGPKAQPSSFAGYRLERADQRDAPDEAWQADAAKYVYSHYTPLADGLKAKGAAPVALAADGAAWSLAAADSRAAYAATVQPVVQGFLDGFQAIPVSDPASGTPRKLSLHPPYYINKEASASYQRAAQNRPKRLAKAECAKLYRALSVDARYGKGRPEEIRRFAQAALDAGLLPNPVTAARLKDFLSDLGVGIDCSGFVSQALNALMRTLNPALTAKQEIHTNAAGLRSKGNPERFAAVKQPADLLPGDTMWKTGHIRIVCAVDLLPDGSVEFATAESSSVSLIGPTAKRWRCPKGDSWKDMQVQRDGRWVKNGETNEFSRYQPLVKATQPSAAAHGLEAPPPMPSASRSASPPPPPPPVAPVPAPSTPAANGLTQTEVDRLAAIAFANANDIEAFFRKSGKANFTDWFNANLGGKGPFTRKGKNQIIPIRMDGSASARKHFADFWNQIPLAYDRPRITALDFAALMCIALNETGGDFRANPEKCGIAGHPGLAYPFDSVPGLKASYNKNASLKNKTAGELFNDPAFIRAHGSLPGAARLAHHGKDFNGAWLSDTYPQAEFSTAEDASVNGFIMQADFYKFRGRGVIQTTGRGGYLKAVNFLQSYGGANSVLADYKQRWKGLDRDEAATVSANADWDRIFGETEMLAKGVALHASGWDYRAMSKQASILNDIPDITKKDAALGMKGSIYSMGRVISGSKKYGAGAYRDRVLAFCKGMLAFA